MTRKSSNSFYKTIKKKRAKKRIFNFVKIFK